MHIPSARIKEDDTLIDWTVSCNYDSSTIISCIAPGSRRKKVLCHVPFLKPDPESNTSTVPTSDSKRNIMQEKEEKKKEKCQQE
jgi:hypothetical protein